MKSLKFLYGLIAVLTVAVPFFAKDKIVESKWTTTPIHIDGAATEWTQDVMETEKRVAVTYAFKNDANHLYLMFIFNDPEFLSTIEGTGLTIWVNTEGKEKKNYGLHFYQKIISPDEFIQEMEKLGQTLTDEKKLEINSKPGYAWFACDAVNKKGEVIPHPGKGIVTYRMGRSQMGVAYEFGIPLALLADPRPGAKSDPSKPVKLGFEWGGLTDEMKKAKAERMADATAQNLGGGNDDQGNNAVKPSSRPGARRDPMKYDFWVDLKLAQNPSTSGSVPGF